MKRHYHICAYLLPLCFITLISAEIPTIPAPTDNKGIDKAIDFFKAYVYAPSSKLLTNNIVEKLEIPELLKLLDNKITTTVDKILDQNKEALSIYNKDNPPTPDVATEDKRKAKIKAIYVDMSRLYESLHLVDFRVKVLYPEEHMQKLFAVLQKIYAKQYQVTYNPEEDTKSFWNIFNGE